MSSLSILTHSFFPPLCLTFIRPNEPFVADFCFLTPCGLQTRTEKSVSQTLTDSSMRERSDLKLPKQCHSMSQRQTSTEDVQLLDILTVHYNPRIYDSISTATQLHHDTGRGMRRRRPGTFFHAPRGRPPRAPGGLKSTTPLPPTRLDALLQ